MSESGTGVNICLKSMWVGRKGTGRKGAFSFHVLIVEQNGLARQPGSIRKCMAMAPTGYSLRSVLAEAGVRFGIGMDEMFWKHAKKWVRVCALCVVRSI